jgi:predicted small secreted protein
MQRKHLAIVITAAFVLTACSDTVGGTGKPGSNAPASSSAAVSSPASSAPVTSTAPISSTAPSTAASSGGSSGAFPTNLAALGDLLVKGGNSVKSAHLELSESAAGTTVAGAGDETVSNGKVTSIDLSESVGATKLRFIIVNGKVFAQLPASVYPAKKPWVEISSTTTNVQLQQLYSSFQSSIQTGTGDSVRVLTSAATGLKLEGIEQLDGTPSQHYSMTVVIANLPSTFPNKAALTQTGLTNLPFDLYVDVQGHVRKVTEDFTVSGQHVTTVVTLSKIDQPVHVTAPPADQVEQA